MHSYFAIFNNLGYYDSFYGYLKWNDFIISSRTYLKINVLRNNEFILKSSM
jgi:hypothetical protein